jgi:tetratricopeptide (TPR) repeat protein
MDDAPSERTAVARPVTGTSWARRPWLLALLLLIVTFLTYQPAWRAGFVWDDDHHLTGNPAMASPRGLHMIWTSLAVSRYYPLTLTSFWLQRRIWGLTPMPYHLVNIALHAINGVLLYSVLRRLRIPAAWLAATLWVLHPVNVESVAWITELKNTQSGFFFFLSILCYLRFEAAAKRRWYALALLCGLAALLSKPSTVILPLALLLCVWWQRGRWRGPDIRRVAPFFGLAAGMSALTVIEQRGQILREGTAEWKLAMPERLIIAGKAIWFYAAKLLWPVHLTFVYPRWEVVARSFLFWLPLAGLVALGAILWARRRQPWARAALFGCGFFVAALLPVLGFVDVFYFRYSFVADHFQYLAGVGLIALIASAAALFCEHSGPAGRRIGTAAALATLLASATLTWKQGHIYRDAETLWRDTLAKNPRCWMAHTNLGNVLQNSGRFAEAEEQYDQALRIKPDYAMAHNDLAVALIAAGKPDTAIMHLEQALRIKPDLVEAQDNLAWLLATLPPSQGGDPDRAVRLARQACELTGYRGPAHLSTLAAAYAARGEFTDAVDTAQKAVDLARSDGQLRLVSEIEAQLQAYRNQHVSRQPAGTPGPTSP